MSGTYDDDIIRVGTLEFLDESCQATKDTFQKKAPETPPVEFTGMLLSKNKDAITRYETQSKYIE